MSIIDSIKSFWKKGKVNMGLGNYLNRVTDDPRINLPPEELSRIELALQYYKNDNQRTLQYHNTYNQQRSRKESVLALTKQVSRQLASLTFNEGMEISIQPHADDENADTSDDDTLDKFIQSVLDSNNFNQNYEEFLETAIASGGFAIRPYIENNQIKLAWIRADQFIPLEANTSRINSAVIVSRKTLTEGSQTIWYSLLEFHEYDEVAQQETITNEVYKSDDKKTIGKNVDISNWEDGLQEKVIINEISRPTFAYFKMPGKNNVNIESPLGVGISENAQSIIDSANQANDQFTREIELAKRRVAIPSYMMRPSMEQEGNYTNQGYPAFEEDEDVFFQVRQDPSDAGQTQGITSIDTTIRNVQYTASIQFYLHALENNVGLSQGTLTTDGAINDKTATEVVSDNSLTYRTRSSILTQCEKQLYGLIRSILELANKPELFDGQAALINYDINAKPIDINLHFEDGVFVDKDAQAKQDLLIVQSGMMPKKQFLVRNYGLSENDADKWLAEIQDEAPETDNLSNEQASMLGGNDGA